MTAMNSGTRTAGLDSRPPAVDLRGVHKNFGHVQAVRGVSRGLEDAFIALTGDDHDAAQAGGSR